MKKARDDIRTCHDEWVKRALSLWLGDLGDVVLDARIAGQSRRGDVLYTERRGRPARRRKLGMLGELARGEMLFEISRNPLTELDLKSHVAKLIELEAHEARAARRDGRKRSSIVHPALCAITPSMSRAYVAAMGLRRVPRGKRGLYTLLGASWRSAIVVANELPRVRGTMWLRLLARGTVQAGAVRELAQMSARDPLRDATLALLIAWRQSLPPPEKQSEADRELTMNLDQVYDRWERKTLARGHREGVAAGKAKGKAEGKAEGMAAGKAEGKAEGMAAGKAEAVLAVLEGRGLTVTAAQRRQVLACADSSRLDAWLRAAGTVSSVKALLSAVAPSRARAKRS